MEFYWRREKIARKVLGGMDYGAKVLVFGVR
jgi:hypothetical protein